MVRFADAVTRVVDRFLFGPPAPPLRQWTPRRYERLVNEHAVVDVPPPQPTLILDRVFPEDAA